ESRAGRPAGAWRARLAPAVAAAESWPRGGSDSDLDRLLRCLASGPPADTDAAFAEWLLIATPKARAGLAGQLQRLLKRELGPLAGRAEEAAAQLVDSAAEACPEVAQVAAAVEEAARGGLRDGVRAAVLVLGRVAALARAGGGGDVDFVVPALDSLVRVFHRPFVAHVRSSWTNLQRWREAEARVGLPRLEEHPPLLGCVARGLLTSLALVPEGSPQASVVVSRDNALGDARAQLPELQRFLDAVGDDHHQQIADFAV
ncbi:unnamed protein product, partial [Prorocentrum cordatum]